MSVAPMLAEIEASVKYGIWSPALISTLVIPDICGAVDKKQPRPSDRWIGWYDEHVTPVYKGNDKIRIDGEVLYKFRNAMIHENTGFARAAFGYTRVVFMLPNERRVVVDRGMIGPEEARMLVLSAPLFISAVVSAAREWERGVMGEFSSIRRERLSQLAGLKSHGVAHFSGAPVIA